MTQFSVSELLNTLLNSENDAWRDDAAQELAEHCDQEKAELALLEAISSARLDDSLRRTCAELLATIWIRSGQINREHFDCLKGVSKTVVEAFLRAAILMPDQK